MHRVVVGSFETGNNGVTTKFFLDPAKVSPNLVQSSQIQIKISTKLSPKNTWMSLDLVVFTIKLRGSGFGRGNMPNDPSMLVCGKDLLQTTE